MHTRPTIYIDDKDTSYPIYPAPLSQIEVDELLARAFFKYDDTTTIPQSQLIDFGTTDISHVATIETPNGNAPIIYINDDDIYLMPAGLTAEQHMQLIDIVEYNRAASFNRGEVYGYNKAIKEAERWGRIFNGSDNCNQLTTQY